MTRVKMSCGRDVLYRLNVEEIKESYNIKETCKESVIAGNCWKYFASDSSPKKLLWTIL